MTKANKALMAEFEASVKKEALEKTAPELLRELKGLVSFWREDFPDSPDGPQSVAYFSPEFRSRFQRIVAVIAKAEGQ